MHRAVATLVLVVGLLWGPGLLYAAGRSTDPRPASPVGASQRPAGLDRAGPRAATAQPATAPSTTRQRPVGPAAQVRPRPAGAKILVLVAAICVVGVSVALIRAIIAQRALRTVSP